jgi:hypothetical protein
MTTLSLVATTFMYDELGAAGNTVGKALCTAAGYTSFEVGATTIIGMLYYFVQKRDLVSSRTLTTDRRQQCDGFRVYHSCDH